MDVKLLHGDCLQVMKTLPDASVDAIVTDPPAGIAFMGKTWDIARSRGHFIDFLTPRMAEAYRVARPGTYALVWALPRTSHWTATAVEDAGWTIRDRVTHLFGTGFPKAKSCLKPGAEDWWLAYKPGGAMAPLQIDPCRIGQSKRVPGSIPKLTGLGGYGKCSGRKGISPEDDGQNPNIGRWPANVVLQHSPDCRLVGTRRVKSDGHHPKARNGISMWAGAGGGLDGTSGPERYMGDADGLETVEAWECGPDCPVGLLDAQSGTLRSGRLGPSHVDRGKSASILGSFSGREIDREFGGDSGGASRFFYCTKATAEDRGEGNDHPTVKSTDLMRWLCRLITPPGGLVLDPFAGSASTGKACIEEGFDFLGIEGDSHYVEIGRRRLDECRMATPLFA